MKKQARHKAQTYQYLLRCDILPGLKPFACQEIKNRYRSQVVLQPSDDPAAIYFRYTGVLDELFSLRTVVAIYLVRQFPIPRPRALLGHQHYQLLLQGIKEVRLLHPSEAFSGLRISAAGENSSVFAQLKEQLSQDTGLPALEEGDLLIRVYPVSSSQAGWEVLIRLTPRPLSTRPWRVFNMKGALNATIAAAMIEMTDPEPNDRFLNLMCGSGTLLVERLQRCPAAIAVGCDTNTTTPCQKLCSDKKQQASKERNHMNGVHKSGEQKKRAGRSVHHDQRSHFWHPGQRQKTPPSDPPFSAGWFLICAQ